MEKVSADLNSLLENKKRLELLNNSLEKLAASVSGDFSDRLRSFQKTCHDVNVSLEAYGTAATHKNTRALVNDSRAALADRVEKLNDLHKLTARITEAQLGSINVRSEMLKIRLEVAQESEKSEPEDLRITAESMLIAQHMQGISISIRDVCLAAAIEEFYDGMLAFLDLPPLVKRARKSLINITRAILRDAKGFAGLGTIEATCKEAKGWLYADDFRQALIRKSVQEYDRINHFNDHLRDIEKEFLWSAKMLETCFSIVVDADQLNSEALKLVE